MDVRELVKQLCIDYEMTQKEIAEAIGMKPSNFSRSLNDDMRLSTFVEIINEIGVEIVIRTDIGEYNLYS